MRVAVEGCGHGTLHAIYASVKKSCEVHGWDGVDLLIIGGDFQAVRNAYDLNTMSVPRKFLAIGDFHEYYSGARTAPYTTLFVGGNHEASSHLQELHYGGWVAKKIYYLGAANVVQYGGLRIAGMSGIWKGYNYRKPHFERLPYTADEIKSIYHVDIGVSHDWPKGIEMMGDYRSLFRQKDLFEADSIAGTLGSVAAKYVMDRLRPPHWFAAHLHCKFAATVKYGQHSESTRQSEQQSEEMMAAPQIPVKNADEIDITLEDDPVAIPGLPVHKPVMNSDEIDLDGDDEELASPSGMVPDEKEISHTSSALDAEPSAVPSHLRSQLPASFARPPHTQPPPALPPPPGITNNVTNFLALDKCLPPRKFLQILDIEPSSASTTSSKHPTLTYDPEWLAILRVFAAHDPHQPLPPDLGEVAYTPLIQAQEAWIEENVIKKDKLTIPENFEFTGPIYDGANIRAIGTQQSQEYTNPQTKAFCEMLNIPNFFDDSEQIRQERRRTKEVQIEAEAAAGGGGHGRGKGGGRGGHGGRGQGRGGRGGRGRGRGYR